MGVLEDKLASLGFGAGNTASGGLNDDLYGKLLAAIPFDDKTGIPREYAGGQLNQYQESLRGDEAEARRKYPRIFGSGQLIGAAPGALAAALAAPAGLPAVGLGTLRGGLQRFGDSTRAGWDRAKDTVKGMAEGGMLSSAGNLIQGLAPEAMKLLRQGGPPKPLPAPVKPPPTAAGPAAAAPKPPPAAFTKPTVPAPPGPLPAAATRPSIPPTVPAPPRPTLRPTEPAPSMRPTAPPPPELRAPAALPPRPKPPGILQPREPTLEAKLSSAYSAHNAPNPTALRPRSPVEEAQVMQELAKLQNLRLKPLPVRNMVTSTDDILAMPGSAPLPSTAPTPIAAFKGKLAPAQAPQGATGGANLAGQRRAAEKEIENVLNPPPEFVPRTAPMMPPPSAPPSPPPGQSLFGEYTGPIGGVGSGGPPPQTSASSLEKAVEEYLRRKGGG